MYTISDLYDLDHTLAKDYLSQFTYPWEALKGIKDFILYFLMISFICTCSILIFAREMSFDEPLIRNNAKFTFLNIFVLSFIFSSIDLISYKLKVEVPLKKILSATDRIMDGDFSFRIEENAIGGFFYDNGFSEIIANFNKMAEVLGSVETLGSDFISNVSHEFKTPLAAMLNYATLLEDPSLSREEMGQYIKAIKLASRRLSDLVSGILKISRIESQGNILSKTTFDLAESLRGILITISSKCEKKGIKLLLDIPNELYVHSDSQLLSLCLTNLVSNGVKYSRDGGKLEIVLKREGNGIAFSIKDEGVGISEEEGKHIFDKFYQADKSHSAEGNGLGLSMVKSILKLLDGKIHVESEKNVGSLFSLYIPDLVQEE